jgi:hypothetical protein
MKRRVGEENVELLVIITIIGVVVGIMLPFLKKAWDAGWPWWAMVLVAAFSLAAEIAYLFGLPYVLGKFVLWLFPVKNSDVVYFVFIMVVWFSLIPIAIISCFMTAHPTP